MSKSVHFPTPLQITAALLIGSFSVLISGIQPVMFGVLLNEHLIELVDVGVLAMAEILMLAVGVVIANIFFALTRLRIIVIIAGLAGGITNLLCIIDHSSLMLVMLRGVAGFTDGILVWAATAIVVRSRRPYPLFAISSLLQLVLQGAIAAWLSVVAVPDYGWRSVFFLLAICSIATSIFALKLPRGVSPLPAVGPSRFGWKPRYIQVLLVAFFQVAAMGALWTFIEPAGQSVGFAAQEIQTLISIVLAIGAGGAVVAMVTVERWHPSLVTTLSSIAMAGLAILMFSTQVGELTRFAILLGMFQFTCIFSLPFQGALAFYADATGRVATIIPFLQLLGQALGPLMASWAVSGNDATPALLACAILAGTATLLNFRLPRPIPLKV